LRRFCLAFRVGLSLAVRFGLGLSLGVGAVVAIEEVVSSDPISNLPVM
jgi:hypothetical protein